MDDIYTPYRSADPNAPGFVAGLPSYPRNFSRDTLLAGLIAGNEELIVSQLNVSAAHQGTQLDPISGEEPGKVHHEYPGIAYRAPLMTTYNACDTTALFVISIASLAHVHLYQYRKFVDDHIKEIKAATVYLKEHVVDGIFWEKPAGGAKEFSLRVTYWKDSVVPNPKVEQPVYPVTYALAHFQAALGVESAGMILEDQSLIVLADDMFRIGIKKFIHQDSFCAMEDASTALELNSSDELHSLAYIPVRYKSLLPLEAIASRAQELITPIGIACTPLQTSEMLSDRYHGHVVWPFEQALIHQGCIKFGLLELADVAARVAIRC